MAVAAKEASRAMARTTTEKKNGALKAMAAEIRRRRTAILNANVKDLEGARRADKPTAFIERMTLNEKRVENIAAALEQVARLPDPVGKTTPFARRPNGLVISKMRVPLGVVAIIYESRPGVTADAAGLCVKSGNAAILRGGKETVRTNAVIAEALKAGLKKAGLPPGAVGFVDDPDRAAVRELLTLDTLIDLVIPRGGPELTVAVRRESMIPVLAHDKGLVHVYVDRSADPVMAERIALNAKTERPGVCNAMETLLVDVKYRHLKMLLGSLSQHGVELRGCERTARRYPTIKRARASDWDTEYLDLVLSVKIVDGVDGAIEHIAQHGSGLAEAIVTKNKKNAERFLAFVDAGAVYHNASTRFTDGGEFGLGAEMGISTQKLHARGPVALEGLTCEKYVVRGKGQTRCST